MSGVRYFSGDRSEGQKKKTIAQEIMRIEVDKGGKMPAEMRYKLIFKRRLEESRKKEMAKRASGETEAGKMVGVRKMSYTAEQALKQIEQKKAQKEAKAMRKMVIVQPARFSNGQLNSKGKIYDIAGNVVGKVNTKNGKMSAAGMVFGKYKPKSYYTKLLIQEAINKHSPYFIQQRLNQQRQMALANVHGQYIDPNIINVHGVNPHAAMLGGNMYDQLDNARQFQQQLGVHGNDMSESADRYSTVGTRGTNATMTAWGAMSDNVMGIMSNNVHGTMADNVWGTVGSDVWGSVSGPDMWGQHGTRFFGTGSGNNYLGKWAAKLFGVSMRRLFGMVGYVSRGERQAMRDRALIRSAYARSSAPRPVARRR